MEKTHIVPKIYGYVVCLVAVIVTLVALGNIVNAIFDRANPTSVSDYRYNLQSHDVSSFAAYKADYQSNLNSAENKTATTVVLSDDQLRTNYEAARTSQIDAVKLGTVKTITVFSILLVVAVGLFASHWIWLRKFEK
ncbi:MAG: hypothetical protein WC773_02205 [Patescibacteria group bacterium]|jgi:hypothetical protein